jgi:hypothetical protein
MVERSEVNEGNAVVLAPTVSIKEAKAHASL